jgi:fengycin family lipopeptide synthetase D
MSLHDPVVLNARKQALKEFVQQQSAADYRDCPFFVPGRQAAGPLNVISQSSTLAPELNARIFAMAAASPLHRQALFSACVKYLAYLHSRQSDGLMAWQCAHQRLPAPWHLTQAELAQPVKRLFGSELAYWKQAAELTDGWTAPAAPELTPPPQVLLAYSEAGAPLGDGLPDGCLLGIGIAASPEVTRLTLHFGEGSLEPALARWLLSRLNLLLHRMVFEPNATLGSLDWIPTEEQAQVAAWSALVPAQPLRYPNLATAIEVALRERPTAVWLECGDQRVDFADLALFSDHLLNDAGWPQRSELGDCLLIVGPKGVETTLAAMVCMRIGVPFCLQPDNVPAAQLASVLAVQQTRVVLLAASSQGLAPLLASHGCRGLGLPGLQEVRRAGAISAPRRADWLRNGLDVQPDDALCVVMTSGSEGTPKGCISTQRALINLTQEKHRLYGAGHWRVASMSNHAFDYFVLECVEAIMLDITLVLVPESVWANAAKTVCFLQERHIDQLFTTTVLAEDIMAQGDIPSLRQLFFGGESLRRFQKHHYELFNFYGPSETGVLTSYAPIHDNNQAITIGRPFGGYQCAIVLPGTTELCPVGVVGELLIGGAGVGLGYLNRPDLTEQAFIQLDTATLQGHFYRSGDLACWNAVGELQILGRRDRQLKVNGFRVELDAIERVLRELPGVEQAAVMGLTDQLGHARLGALVVPAHDNLTEQVLRAKLAERVPGYMIPGQMALVATLPLSRNGKLDRRQLPALLAQSAQTAVVTPQSATQRWLAASWARHLELDAERLPTDRSFFSLGGHSLLAVRMLAEAERAFGQSLSLLEFFRHDTIASLAQLIDTQVRQSASAGSVTFPDLLDSLPAEDAASGPLSPQEARLYAQYCLYPDSLAYLLEMDVSLPAELGAEAVAAALQGLLTRHDILRTRYRLDDSGTPYAEVLPELAVEQVLLAEERWQQVRARAFKLEDGPLLRGCLLHGANGSQLQLQIHHILVDEPAMAMLQQEFKQLLQGQALPAVGPSYRRYALALHQARQLPLWQTAQAFWQNSLQGLEFDPFGHGAVEAGGQMSSLHWQLSAEEHAAARRLCARLNLTPAVFFLALWGLVVARESGRSAFSISVANAYHSRHSLGTVGMFVVLVPCAFRFDQRGQRFADYARQLADAQWQIMDQLFYPVEEVFPLLAEDPRRFGSNPLLNIAYSYLEGAEAEAAHAPDFAVEAQGPLSLAITQSEQACLLALEYQQTAFNPARIESLVASYRSSVQQVLGCPDSDWAVDDWIGAAGPMQPPLRPGPSLAIDERLRQNFLSLDRQLALIDDDGEMTWRELACLTAGYAERLNRHDVRRALIIGANGRQLQAFLAACFLTHTTYLALERGTPAARIEEVIQHAAPDWVIDTERQNVAASEQDWRHFTSIKHLDDNPIAWILYSSGTTGRPKGICVTARTVAQYLESLLQRLQLPRGLRVTQQFSPSFDGYLEEVLLAWALQGTSLVVDRYSLLDERRARDFLSRCRPDVISAAPALLSSWNRMHDLQPLPRVCISGGDFLAPADIQHLSPHMQIWNSYGPTETCIAASMFECSQFSAGATLPIGAPFDHLAFAIVDGNGHRLRDGQWGELLIYGELDQHGYLDDPELSAARFGRDAHGTYFRTGDMAMRGTDGLYILRGRMDDSCKVRGNFIGLGELEGKASQYPGVAAAGAAVAWAGTAEACLVLAVEGESSSLGGLQQHLARHYTRSHLPSAIFPVARLPRTDTGKLDRQGVVALFHGWREQVPAPAHEAELAQELRTLIGCWRNSLVYQGALAPDSDFFLVSGSSLSAVRLAGQIEQHFGISFGPVDVFRNPTIAAQQALIEARQGNASVGEPVHERLLSPDVPGTPKLLLLPPALGGLQELQSLADRWAGRVTTAVLALDADALVDFSVPQLAAALQQALQTSLAAAAGLRPVWLGGYSLGAEMLAVLLEQQASLARSLDRVIFLDPNPRTRVFEGQALLDEFVEGARALGVDAVWGGLPDLLSESSLRQQRPAVYREWRVYRLQHGYLGGRAWVDRATALAALDAPVALVFSEDAAEHELANLPVALQTAVRRLPGDHVEFLGHLEPDAWLPAGQPRVAGAACIASRQAHEPVRETP